MSDSERDFLVIDGAALARVAVSGRIAWIGGGGKLVRAPMETLSPRCLASGMISRRRADRRDT